MEQKGFLKNRYIGENIRTLYDVIQYLNEKQKLGMLLQIDFEKAFDSIEWKYINVILERYNFGSDFIKWFNIIYKNSSSCVINNGHFSEFFKLSRSCRQGDPLSPYIFILAIEPLAVEIAHNVKIKGVPLDGCVVKLVQYADDTFLLLDGSEESLRHSIQVLRGFTVCSGLAINLEKTQAVWLGSGVLNEGICGDLNLRWVKEFVVLGINFSVHLDQLEGLNFEKKIIELEKLFDVYSMFNLSLVGKLTVIKTLALPKLVYLLSVLPTPSDTIFNILETKINNFIWKGKERISQKQLQKDISNGGLNLTNLRMFNKALKLTWIKRLVQNSGNWQNIFEVSIGLNKKHVWELDMQSLNCIRKGIQNQFWKDVLSS